MNRLKKLCAAASLVGIPQLISIAHAQDVSARVINGRPVQGNEFPWMVALLDSSNGDSTEAHFCGGTLIADRWVLTAAHCVSGQGGALLPPSYIEVLVGKTRLPFGRGDRKELLGIARHPEFNPVTLENDFALLKLKEALPGPYLAVAGIADLGTFPEGTVATVTGWGQKDPELPILPIDLLKGNVRTLSDNACLETVGRWFKPDSMICAGPTGTGLPVDPCYGDSGGPLLARSGQAVKQIGVVSWGLKCGDKPGVYSETALAERFITSFPVIAPVSMGDAKIQGAVAVGSIVSCVPGDFDGDEPEYFRYTWYLDEQERKTSAADNTYLISESDAGGTLYCRVVAGNKGGESEQYSTYETVPLVEVTPTPEPTPTATPTPVVDTNPPASSVKKFRCKNRTCELTVEASDDGDSGRIASVTVAFTRAYKGCSSDKACAKSSQLKEMTAVSTGKGWTVKVPRGKTDKTQVLTFFVRALDSAGNWQNEPLKHKVTLKKSKE